MSYSTNNIVVAVVDSDIIDPKFCSVCGGSLPPLPDATEREEPKERVDPLSNQSLTKEEIQDMCVKDLREALSKRNLSNKGRKVTIIFSSYVVESTDLPSHRSRNAHKLGEHARNRCVM